MPETVILLHGLWIPAKVMGLLAMRLRRCGYQVHLFAYPSLAATLEDNARQLAAFVREQDGAPIHLVGHSLGGLVILQALQIQPDLVSGRIVLLGSPVNGSSVARRLQRSRGLSWLLGRSGQHGLLGDGPAWRGHLQLGVIAGERAMGIGQVIGGLTGDNDGTVSVAETQLEHASGSLRINTTHMGLLVSREVADEVCHFLKHGQFSRD